MAFDELSMKGSMGFNHGAPVQKLMPPHNAVEAGGPVNLCKDCKYFSSSSVQLAAICMHPRAPVNPVYGNKDATCALLRSANCLVFPTCGSAGHWFEKRQEV